MNYFYPENMIIVDKEAEKDFLKQAVYEYGEKFELSIITYDEKTYNYALFFCGHEGNIDSWPQSDLSKEDIDKLMKFLVSLTGKQPVQI